MVYGSVQVQTEIILWMMSGLYVGIVVVECIYCIVCTIPNDTNGLKCYVGYTAVIKCFECT